MSRKRETVPQFPFLQRYADSGIYYLRTAINGKTKEYSTHTDKLNRALTQAKRLMATLGGDPSAVGSLTYNDLRDEILLAQSNKSKATYDSARYQFAKLDRYFKGFPAEKLSDACWQRYYLFSKQEEPNRQLEHDRRHFMMLCNLAYRRGLLKHPVRIKKIVSQNKVGRALDPAEVERLVEAARASSADLYLQILMALTMGMRKSEILRLEWDRVDLVKGLVTLRVQDTKIRQGRTFGISELVLAELKVRTVDGPFLFRHRTDSLQAQTTLKTLWTEIRSLSKVKCRFHDLRHTFLTNAFKEAVNPALICNFAGLSLEEAQKTYLHITPEDTRVVLKNTWGALGNKK